MVITALGAAQKSATRQNFAPFVQRRNLLTCFYVFPPMVCARECFYRVLTLGNCNDALDSLCVIYRSANAGAAFQAGIAT